MEGKGLQGRMYPNSGVGMLGLEIPLHQSNQPQNPQIQIQNHQHQQMLSSSSSHLPQQHQLQQFQQQQHDHQTQLSMQQPTNYMGYNNPSPSPNPNPSPNMNMSMAQKTQVGNSDEDEPGGGNENENAAMDGKRKGGGSNSNMSPWQRMKWTDNMVRLLIMAVYYIGDEAGNEAGPEKKKSGPGGPSGGGGGGLLQKKGKWKSVSRAMMEKGFYVSPQQCEDKFNDLNKRYKRVNDILGKGTACKVVENQALLETMDISPKMKEEARKLLNSKHLFFREMCAYHNSCGHGPGATTTTPAAEVQHNPQSIPNNFQQNPQQLCSHSGAIQHNGTQLDVNDDDDHDEDDDEDEDDDDDDDDDDDEDEEDDPEEGGRPRKRARTVGEGMPMPSNPQAWQRLNGEMVGMLQDGGKNPWEKKQWIKTQLVQLEEQGLKFQYQALELEKQRMKWVRFSTKKEREMEKLKIVNERKRLENQRMVILMRQKEIELFGEQNPSCVSTC